MGNGFQLLQGCVQTPALARFRPSRPGDTSMPELERRTSTTCTYSGKYLNILHPCMSMPGRYIICNTACASRPRRQQQTCARTLGKHSTSSTPGAVPYMYRYRPPALGSRKVSARGTSTRSGSAAGMERFAQGASSLARRAYANVPDLAHRASTSRGVSRVHVRVLALVPGPDSRLRRPAQAQPRVARVSFWARRPAQVGPANSLTQAAPSPAMAAIEPPHTPKDTAHHP